MNKILIVFGNISFDGQICTVHEVHQTMLMETVTRAQEIGEDLVNYYDGYVIPCLYKGSIIWQS